jgi:hypothetical protein
VSGYWWLLTGLTIAAIALSVTGLYLAWHSKETGKTWDT